MFGFKKANDEAKEEAKNEGPNLGMLTPMFKPMLAMLRKTATEHGIGLMVLSFDEGGELVHNFYKKEDDMVIMKRAEFDELIKSLIKEEKP